MRGLFDALGEMAGVHSEAFVAAAAVLEEALGEDGEVEEIRSPDRGDPAQEGGHLFVWRCV